MPLLSEHARRRKIDFFLARIDRDERILEVGCGDGWVGEWCRQHGRENYVGLDLRPPADIVGDIRNWRKIGLEPASFDVIIAFEVVEHIDCSRECYDLLVDGGRMMVTTPVPQRDWILRLLERLGLNQPRQSPHDNLVDLREVPLFERKEIRIIAGLSQWAILHKEPDRHNEDGGSS